MTSLVTPVPHQNLEEINNACKESLLGYVYYLKGLPKNPSPYAVGGPLYKPTPTDASMHDIIESCAEGISNLCAFIDGWNTAQKENESRRERIQMELGGGLEWLEVERIL